MHGFDFIFFSTRLRGYKHAILLTNCSHQQVYCVHYISYVRLCLTQPVVDGHTIRFFITAMAVSSIDTALTLK